MLAVGSKVGDGDCVASQLTLIPRCLIMFMIFRLRKETASGCDFSKTKNQEYLVLVINTNDGKKKKLKDAGTRKTIHFFGTDEQGHKVALLFYYCSQALRVTGF